jgi:hypothetical protein
VKANSEGGCSWRLFAIRRAVILFMTSDDYMQNNEHKLFNKYIASRCWVYFTVAETGVPKKEEENRFLP